MEIKKAEVIKVFAAELHSHVAGYGMRVRHVRDEVELPPIIVDDNYDFNFQEYRFLPQEVEVKKVRCFFWGFFFCTDEKIVSQLSRENCEIMLKQSKLFYPYWCPGRSLDRRVRLPNKTQEKDHKGMAVSLFSRKMITKTNSLRITTN